MVKFLFRFIIGLFACTVITECMALSVTPANSSTFSYSTSWIGNSFSGGSKWVQNHIDGMYVAADGTVYTNSGWDEGGREVGIYKDGDVVGSASATHGWGRLGGTAVTANNKYIYAAIQQASAGKAGEDYPPSGTTWYAVRRYKLSGEPAPFPGGRGYDKSMLIVSTSNQITGLANTGSNLYVSDSAANRIRVYDSETLKDLQSWSLKGARQIAVDRKGELWIVQDNDQGSKILHFSKTGTQLPGQIAINPTALAVDNQGRLLVAVDSPSQQVQIYNITNKPTLIGTFGNKGGIYSGKRGEVGKLKFYGITGLGTDSAGNIYVNSGGFYNAGTDLRKFSPSGVMQWQLLGLEFVDNADADPGTDGVDLFTKEEHFVMDYSKGSGKGWTYRAYTLDKFRYPDDPRLHWSETSAFVRRIQGKRFLYLTDMVASHLVVFRFDGEIAIPCAIFVKKHVNWPTNQPASGRWIWRDANGDGSIQSNEYENLGGDDDSIWGWEVDSNGDIWQASESSFIRHYRLQGVDAHGSPIYSGAASEQIRMPAPFNKLTRIKYFPAQDVMYLAGYTLTHPQTGNEWGIVGTEIVRYDNWTKAKKVRWRAPLPYDPNANPMLIIKAIDVAGDRVFAVDSRKAQVYIYNATTGAFISKLTPGPEVAKESGWIDIPYGLRAYRRANGEYVVFAEEDTKAKVIVYRFVSNN